jgi:hypothetical protein
MLSGVGLTMNDNGKKYTCFICGFRTLDERCDWEICPVCFWEDDVLATTEDRASSANRGMMVSTAQANFIRYGAVLPELVSKVRPPSSGEEKDPGWKPFPRALEILDGMEKVAGSVRLKPRL